MSRTVPAGLEVDLLGGELENDVRTTVRSFLADRCEPDAVAAIYDGDRGLVDTLWKGLTGELGLAGLLVPEELGGVGASARETAVVMEELGRYAAPVPYLTSAVIATGALLAGGDARTEAGTALLRRLAAGEATAALALPLPTSLDSPLPAPAAGATLTSVAGALEADTLLLAVPVGDRVTLRAVPAGEVTVTAVESLDQGRQLADVTLPGSDPAGLGEEVVSDASEAVRRALLTGTTLLAAEQVGLAQWCLTETVDYLKQRRQFGRIVGGFQAVKHRLADLFTDVEGASAAATYAAAALAEYAAGEADATEAELAMRTAAAWCGDVAVTAGEEAIQLHGGIGMTWEHPAHLYLKKAKADQIALGLPGAHRDALGQLVGLTL